MAAGFPVPVTPSPPLSAHPIEVERARIAEEAARRSPAVTQPSILYEDEWIIAVNKPAGRYCEDVLAGVVELLAGCGGCSRLAGSGSVIAVEKNGVGFDSIGAGREATQLPQGDGSVESNQLLADNIRQHEDAEVLVGLNIEAGDGVRENRDGSGPAPRCGEAEVSATRVHIRPDEAKLAKQSRREVGVARDGNVVQAKEALAYMVHRLDRDTSGVQIVAKSKHAAAAFMKLFADRQVHKTYLALGYGAPPDQREFTLRTGHGRSRHGMFRVYAEEDVGRSLPGAKAAKVQSMETRFEVLGTFAPGEGYRDWTFGTAGMPDVRSREGVNGEDRCSAGQDGSRCCEADGSGGGLSEEVGNAKEVAPGDFGEVRLDVRQAGRGCEEAGCSKDEAGEEIGERSDSSFRENGRVSSGSPRGLPNVTTLDRPDSAGNDDVHVHKPGLVAAFPAVSSRLVRQNGTCEEQPSAKGSEETHELQNSTNPTTLGRELVRDWFVLLRCHPLTGRTHQIRLHCLFVGLPLVGDARYGGLLELDGREQAAHCLHAESLALKHPFLGTHLSIRAPDPSWASVAT